MSPLVITGIIVAVLILILYIPLGVGLKYEKGAFVVVKIALWKFNIPLRKVLNRPEKKKKDKGEKKPKNELEKSIIGLDFILSLKRNQEIILKTCCCGILTGEKVRTEQLPFCRKNNSAELLFFNGVFCFFHIVSIHINCQSSDNKNGCEKEFSYHYFFSFCIRSNSFRKAFSAS